MFTGIITDVGRVRAVDGDESRRRIAIDTAYDMATVAIGASIACSGTCLTVVAKGPGWFAADVSPETLACTTLGGWQVGGRVNLERPLRAGDEFGGHIVQGHVDGVGTIAAADPVGDSHAVAIDLPTELTPYVAAKGSIAIDGVSLTVNRVDDRRFAVNIIAHTWHNTTFADLVPGARLNIEVDVLSRYVESVLSRSKPIG